MRLSNRQKEIIGNTAIRHFGEGVRVYLFGSRTRSDQKGGDIDLLLEGVQSEQMNIRKKAALIVDLKKLLGDQKIDVVFRNAENQDSAFMQVVDKSKIRLC